MNLVNRILVVIELVAAIVLSLVFIGLLLVNRAAIQNAVAPSLAIISAQAPNSSQVICLGILVLILAFAVLLLLLELAPRGVHRLKVESVQGVEVLMSADALVQQLEYALDALSDVLKVRAQIVGTNKGKGVDVFVELWTTANADVKAKTEEAAGVARQVIEDKLGLQVGRIQIKLDQMKAPAKKGLPTAKA
jgi:hypothetical protein